MKTIKNLRRGDTVCIIDYPRYGEITETYVKSRGRKFVTVESNLRFRVQDLQHETYSWTLFLGSKQEYIAYREKQNKRTNLLREINSSIANMNYNQLLDLKNYLKNC